MEKEEEKELEKEKELAEAYIGQNSTLNVEPALVF
jgi:hypothetical protein